MDLSSLNTSQQIILFLLLIVGSQIIISSAVLYVRKRAFEIKFKGISEERRRSRVEELPSRMRFDLRSHLHPGDTDVHLEDQQGLSDGSSKAHPDIALQTTPTEAPPSQPADDHIQWVDDDQITVSDTKPRHNHHHHHHHHRVFPMVGVGARHDLNNDPRDVPPNPAHYDQAEYSGFKSALKETRKYFSASKGLISRNSQFHGLTPEEREELGGVEYKAVSFLSVVVPTYFFSFLVLGMVGVGSWVVANRPSVAQEDGLSPFWTGAFFATSAFANSGMALLDKNMTALQTWSVLS